MADDQSKQEKDPVVAAAKPVVPTVNWDDSTMKTSYANVVNASSTREEVTLFFGTNLTWNPGESRAFNVRLSDRIVLNPYAAKRLWILIGALLKEYETRFGPLKMDMPAIEPSQRGNSAAAS
jgi:hypothetical protein